MATNIAQKYSQKCPPELCFSYSQGGIGKKGAEKRALNVWFGRDFLASTPSVRQPLFETSDYRRSLGPEVSPRVYGGCPRECPTGCLQEPSGPQVPECPKKVSPRVSPECPLLPRGPSEDIWLPRGKNCRGTIFAPVLPLNLPSPRGYSRDSLRDSFLS